MDVGRIGTGPTGIPIAFAVNAPGPVLARGTPVGHKAALAVNPMAIGVVISLHIGVVKKGGRNPLHVGGIVSDSVSYLIELLYTGAAAGMLCTEVQLATSLNKRG